AGCGQRKPHPGIAPGRRKGAGTVSPSEADRVWAVVDVRRGHQTPMFRGRMAAAFREAVTAGHVVPPFVRLVGVHWVTEGPGTAATGRGDGTPASSRCGRTQSRSSPRSGMARRCGPPRPSGSANRNPRGGAVTVPNPDECRTALHAAGSSLGEFATDRAWHI